MRGQMKDQEGLVLMLEAKVDTPPNNFALLNKNIRFTEQFESACHEVSFFTRSPPRTERTPAERKTGVTTGGGLKVRKTYGKAKKSLTEANAMHI